MNRKEIYQKLDEWIEKTNIYCLNSAEYIIKKHTNDNLIEIIFFSKTNKYSIIVIPEWTLKKSWLSCSASLRKPYAGENYTKGNDLADGEFSEETWNKILYSILGNELVEIYKPKTQENTIEEREYK